MKTFAIILALLAFLSLPVYADPVTAGALVTLLAPGSGALDARPATATAPLGETVITWVTLTAASTELFVTFLDRSGATISGPTAVGLGNLNPLTAVAAATPTGFMVAFDADTTATAGFRNVSFRTFNLTGGQTGSGQANVSTALDDTAPKVAGNANGEYVVAWTRMSAFGATPTAGIYMRRFTNTGTAIDPNDVRCDDPSSLNFQRQGGTAVGMWPSGKVVVAWTDGQFGATPGVNSPDGHGQGIVCRFFDNLILTPTTPVMIANSVTSDDQFEPIIAVDNRDRCLIGWCGDITPNRVDAWCRRFDDQGNALDTSDLNLTPNNATTDTFLMSIAGTPSGEWVATWQDNSNTLNEPAPRCGWARMNQNRAVFDSGVTETGGLATESHAFPRAAMDYYGNMVIAWQVRSGTQVGIRYRRYARTMMAFTTTTPPVGGAITVSLDSPSDLNGAFFIGASAGVGPIPVDNRFIKLTQDALLNYVLYQNGWAGPIFINFAGFLNGSGQSSGVGVVIPNDPALANIQINFAFLTDGGPPSASGVNTISDTYSITIQ